MIIVGLTLTGGDAANGEGYHWPSRSGIWGEDGGAIRSRENLTIADSVITGNAAGSGSDAVVVDAPCYTSGECENEQREQVQIDAGAGGRGGGVWVEGANLTVTGSHITGNRAGELGEGAHGFGLFDGGPGSAGGLGVFHGNLTIASSTISDNSTGLRGSGATAFGPSTGSGFGGGVFARSPEVTITSSTISGNRSLIAAAIGAAYSDIEIDDSTISRNEALVETSGIRSIYSDLAIVHSTLSGNEVTGASHPDDHAVVLQNADPHNVLKIIQSTITRNSGGVEGGYYEVGLQGALIAGNGDSHTDVRWGSTFVSSVFQSQDSLIGAADIAGLLHGENGNQVGTLGSPIDPRLAPLADNGGPTLTHALLPNSPALNAGDPAAVAGADGVSEFDQRGEGFARVLEGRIDIGAFEGFFLDSPAISGDFNADGVVDTLDNEAWRATYGATVDPYTLADGNGNGRIDAGDYTVWRDNFKSRDVDILRTSLTPTIDGTPDPLWEDVPSQAIENTVFGSVDSPSDASGTWRAVWDETAIYLYAEISDQRLIRDSSFAFEDDGLEVFFDADLSRQATYDGVDDTQYMFRLADSLPVGSPDSPVGATEGVVYATGSNPTGGGYTIEAAIPWTALKADNPLAGQLFGLEFALQDDDDGGGINPDGADGRRQWHGTSNQAFRRPSAFGVAALSPRFAQPPAASLLINAPQEAPQSLAESAPSLDEGFASLEPAMPRSRTPVRDPLRDQIANSDRLQLLLIVASGAAEEEALESEVASQSTPEEPAFAEAFDAAFAASVR